MSDEPLRHVPVRPNLEQLKHQAKDLLRAMRAGDAAALEELRTLHPRYGDGTREAAPPTLSDAQLVLARSYGVASWPRLATACKLIDAIWRSDVEAVREMVTRDPKLLAEDARGVKGNWGPPMSYAANLGRDEMIEMLRGQGAADVQFAFGRACLQGQLETARRLMTMGARLVPGEVMGPCETQSGTGLKFLLELGAELADENGDKLAPVGLVLETYSRNPKGKHLCLEQIAEVWEREGKALPDTPSMAVHRGRIDLLEAHWKRDPNVLNRTFTHAAIYPREVGCHEDETLALHGTPLKGGTLLHLCVDFDELEIAEWLLAHGADVNARAAVDADGFGGHTALFGCAVSQPWRNGRQRDAGFTRLLLEHGADVSLRASLRKRLRFVRDETEHVFRDVTAMEWGERFQDQDWVNPEAMRLIREAAGG